MSTKPEKTDSTDVKTMKRRTYLKSGATVMGVAAAGGGAMHSDRLTPVDNAEAGVFTAGIAVGVAAGFMSGVAVSAIAGGGEDAEEINEDLVEDRVYTRAEAVASQRASEREEIKKRWLDAPIDNNPTADAVFTEAEALAVKAIVGDADVNPKQVALEAVDKHISIAAYNAIQGRNSAFIGSDTEDGIITAMAASLENETGQFFGDGEKLEPIDTSINGVEKVDASIVEKGTYALGKYQLSGDLFPMPLSEIDEIDEDNVETIAWKAINSGGGATKIMYGMQDFFGKSFPNMSSYNLEITHPDYSTSMVVNEQMYVDYFKFLKNLRTELVSQVETYVEQLDQQLSEGVIEPSDIVPPSVLVDQFADSDQQTRAAAHLAASGAHVPEGDLSYQAEVSHPDLESESLWGTLFVSFLTSVEPTDIKPGVTIAASDYDIAYLQFERADTGEPITEILSADSGDLEVLDVTGLESNSEQDATGGAETETSEAGKPYVWLKDNGEAPDPIQFPADHSDWTVEVVGDVNTATVSVSDIKEDETGYYVEGTSLADGETIEEVRLVEPVSMSKTTTYVADGGTVNEDQIKARLDGLADLQDRISDLEDDSTIGGGGGLGLGNPFSEIGGLVVQAIGAFMLFILGLFGLSAATS